MQQGDPDFVRKRAHDAPRLAPEPGSALGSCHGNRPARVRRLLAPRTPSGAGRRRGVRCLQAAGLPPAGPARPGRRKVARGEARPHRTPLLGCAHGGDRLRRARLRRLGRPGRAGRSRRRGRRFTLGRVAPYEAIRRGDRSRAATARDPGATRRSRPRARGQARSWPRDCSLLQAWQRFPSWSAPVVRQRAAPAHSDGGAPREPCSWRLPSWRRGPQTPAAEAARPPVRAPAPISAT